MLEKAIIDRKAKTGRYPKAIVQVALYGMPYDCERIMAIADKYGIPVMEDATEGMGSRFNGQVLGTFGRYGVLSFNGNKMITTSGGGVLICNHTLNPLNPSETLETAEQNAQNIMWYATQARDAYPYYQHTAIGYNYRMSNVCAGIDRGQMTVLDAHIAHHKHVQRLYKELLKDVPGVHLHEAPVMPYENDNDNLGYRVTEGPNMVAYTNGVSESLFKVGFCLSAGPYVSDNDVRYIVDCIKEAIKFD